jgi:polar amino acid transport system substrate-binding protein
LQEGFMGGRVAWWLIWGLLIAAGAGGEPAKGSLAPIVVGIDQDFPPYEFVDESGQPSGFAVDLFRAVAARQGIQFKIRAGPWAEIRQQIESGEIDVSTGMVRTDAREERLDFTAPTVVVEYAGFVRADSPVTSVQELSGKVIAVERGDVAHDHIVERGYPVRLDLVPSPKATLEQVAAGEAEAAFVLLDQGLYLLRQHPIGELRSIPVEAEPVRARFAVPEDRDDLRTRLGDGLQQVRASGEYDAIWDRWLGIYHPPSFWSSWWARTLASGAGGLLLLAAAFGLWSWTLRRRVAERTRELLVAEEERRKLRDQLLHSQKMEALGRLAAGVAHDFNNMLTLILGGLHIARDALAGDESASRTIESARDAARSAGQLVEQLLAFGRRQEVKPQRLDWNRVIEEQREIIRRVLGSRITLETQLEPDLEPVMLDPGQASQIIINMVVNARDATEGNGTIRITTRGRGSEDKRWVRLSVFDDGKGMGEETRTRVFEPFFTTKENGTGLGLSTMYGIVEQNGGHIEVESSPGRGAVFHVDLPGV